MFSTHKALVSRLSERFVIHAHTVATKSAVPCQGVALGSECGSREKWRERLGCVYSVGIDYQPTKDTHSYFEHKKVCVQTEA